MATDLVWVTTALCLENEAVIVGVGRTAEAAAASLRKNLEAEAVRVRTADELLEKWIEDNWGITDPNLEAEAVRVRADDELLEKWIEDNWDITDPRTMKLEGGE